MLGPQFTRAYMNRAHKGHSEVSFEPAAQSKIAESKARQTIRIRELASALARRPRHTWRASKSAWTFAKHRLDRSQSEPQGLGPCRRHDQSNAVFAGIAPARACDDFDLHRGEVCRSLRPQQNAIAPICSGDSIAVIRCSPAMSSWRLSPGSSSGWFTSDVLLGTATHVARRPVVFVLRCEYGQQTPKARLACSIRPFHCGGKAEHQQTA